MANVWQRFKYAVTGDIRSLRTARRPSQRKLAPFLWPAYVDEQPQWQITDYDSYVNEGYNLNSLIYSAIMYKARAQIASPLRAYAGDVEDPEPLPPDDPLSRLIARPNLHQSQFLLL
jgi:phage portal protein BeeE